MVPYPSNWMVEKRRMTRFVISDLHLAHANIIDYCDRPFEDVDEMNRTLVRNWNRVVDEGDTVIVVGDLVMGDHDEAMKWAERLSGTLLLVPGNHDDIVAEDAPFPVVDSCTVSHGKYEFGVGHRPSETPDADWELYGHLHNNDLETHPFIDPQRNRVNVSAELVQYEPIALGELCSYLDCGERIRQL